MNEEKTVSVKYGSVKNSQTFAQAMGKLMNIPLDQKTAYRLKRIRDGITSKIDTIRKEFREEVIEKYGKRGEDGKLVSNPMNPDAFEPDETKFQEFLDADKAFAEKTFKLDWYQIPGFRFDGQLFTANEMGALEGIIDWEQEAPAHGTPEHSLGAQVLPMTGSH